MMRVLLTSRHIHTRTTNESSLLYGWHIQTTSAGLKSDAATAEAHVAAIWSKKNEIQRIYEAESPGQLKSIFCCEAVAAGVLLYDGFIHAPRVQEPRGFKRPAILSRLKRNPIEKFKIIRYIIK